MSEFVHLAIKLGTYYAVFFISFRFLCAVLEFFDYEWVLDVPAIDRVVWFVNLSFLIILNVAVMCALGAILITLLSIFWYP